jgi:hypothetical protein
LPRRKILKPLRRKGVMKKRNAGARRRRSDTLDGDRHNLSVFLGYLTPYIWKGPTTLDPGHKDFDSAYI